MQKLLKKAFKPELFWRIPLILCLLLTFVWYKPGLVIGGGEEGLAFAIPQKSAEFYKYPWIDSEIGIPQTVSYSRYPVFAAMALINKIGIPASFLQIFLFISLLVIGGIGFYFLTLQLTDNYNIALISSLFYLFNSYTYANVWHRFLTPLFFFFALLPLSILFFDRFLESKKIINLLLFVIFNLLFSYSFSSPAFIIVLWAVLSVFSLTKFIIIKGNLLKKLNPFFLLVLTLSIWIITNWWWFGLLLTDSSSFFSQIFSSEYNLQVLKSLSSQYPFTVFMKLGYPSVLPNYVSIINTIIPIVAIIGFFKIKKLKNKVLLIVLFLISLFVLNGTNPPLGFLFEFLFKNISIFELLRNPYEKFGIVLVFVYAVLFGASVNYLVKKKKLLGYAILTLIIGIYFSLWKNSVFGSKANNVYVSIPNDYQKIDKLMDPGSGAYRAIVLPFIPGDGIKTIWKHSFQGTQPDRMLFNINLISKILRLKEFDDYWKTLRLSLYQGKLPLLVKYSAVKFLVLHKDLDSKALGISDSEKELSFVKSAYQSDFEKSVIICPNYLIGKMCDLSNTKTDWNDIRFIKIFFNKGLSGSLKVDFQDNNSKHLVFNGQIEDLFQVRQNMDSVLIDLRVPTEKYNGFSASKIKYLNITFEGSTQSNLNINKIEISKGKEVHGDYLNKIEETKNLELFKFDDKYVYPRIYSPKTIENLGFWFDLLYEDNTPDAFVFNKDKIVGINYDQQLVSPKVSFIKINPVKYEISVSDVNGPYWLVFSETYNNDWKLLGVDKYNHFIVNGFTNGYYIESSEDHYLIQYNEKR